MDENNAAKDQQVADITKDRDKYKAELESFKNEFQLKMTQIKIMEMELEEKLAE